MAKLFSSSSSKSLKEEPEYVPCYTCRHLILKTDARRVKEYDNYRGMPETVYCPEHKPPYDEVHSYDYGMTKHYYVHRMEVDKDGVPVGFMRMEKKDGQTKCSAES